VVQVAQQNGAMERDQWRTPGREVSFTARKPRKKVARSCGTRAARLNLQVPTQKVTVSSSLTHGHFWANLFDAVNGGSIYRHEFVLTEVGEKIESGNRRS